MYSERKLAILKSRAEGNIGYLNPLMVKDIEKIGNSNTKRIDDDLWKIVFKDSKCTWETCIRSKKIAFEIADSNEWLPYLIEDEAICVKLSNDEKDIYYQEAISGKYDLRKEKICMINTH